MPSLDKLKLTEDQISQVTLARPFEDFEDLATTHREGKYLEPRERSSHSFLLELIQVTYSE